MASKLRGVCYDVGSVMLLNWRPHFESKSVGREIEIIKNDLNCNAIRITGLDIRRLVIASEIALNLGLQVWLSPTMWNKEMPTTLKYIQRVAIEAEKLNQKYPDQLVLCVGGEFTLFINGIVKGKAVTERMASLKTQFNNEIRKENVDSIDAISHAKAGEHNLILNRFLEEVATSVRHIFHGKIAYASLIWENVDWNLFDYVGIDHYRVERIKNQYVDLLKPAFEHGKPVVITEFGVQTHRGAEINGAGLDGNIIDSKSLFFHSFPIIGRLVRPKLIEGSHVRDEGLQARELVDQLDVLDKAGVYGAFVSLFVSQIHPYNDDPKYDLDMGSMSLVKTFSKGKHGTTYPDMNWEPKESFKAVAKYYGQEDP